MKRISLWQTHWRALSLKPASTVSAVQSEQEMLASGVQPGLLRISVGLEDIEDIIEDLDQALMKLG